MLEHESTCEVKQTLHFPPPEKKIEFKHFGRAYGPSHTCYYDFECALQKDRPQGIIEARHRGIAYAYIIIDRRYNIVEKDFYLGPNSATHFVNKLSSSWARITREQPYYHLHMSNEQMESYKSQTMCEICDEPFGPKIVKNRHHDHSLSEHNYLAALCSRCNLQCKDGYKYLHAFSHNAAYDLGVLLNELGNVPKRNVDIMSKDGCKFMKVDIDFLRFMDSLALLNGSLAKLAKEHIDSGKPTTFTLAMLDKVPAEAHNLLLTGKQSFCYDYVSNWDVLNEPRLPPRDAFFNTLTQEELPEKEYKQALEVFKLAKCRNIGEYLVLYLKVDTGILADIFTVWRRTMLDLYRLDIAYYLSLSSFAWDAFLFKSKVVLDPISDPRMYDLIRRNLRGGFTSVVKQLSTAENHYTGAGSGEDGTHILYLDFNSLYATCMSEKLPTGGFRCLTDAERDEMLLQGLRNIDCNQERGYWILCDTKQVSPDVARYTDDLPLILAHADIVTEQLSEYSKSILVAENRKLPRNNRKLIATHEAQRDYLISLDFLQLLMRLGVEVSRVHTIFEFEQRAHLKSFVDSNIRERTNSTCAIKSKAFKLVNNAIYGKSLTNLERYANKYYLTTTRKQFLKHARSPFFKRATLLSEDRVLCTTRKDSLTIDTPTYLGFQILQIAKRRLYSFWYDTVKAKYGDKAKLLYTDTDSYIIQLTCRDAFEELNKAPLIRHIDFSNFPEDHSLYSIARKGKLGLLKSEVGSKIITQLVALKPKMYSLVTLDKQHICRCKGITRRQQAGLEHSSFIDALETNTSRRFVTRTIRNVGGQMCTCVTVKRGLSAFDDKRYVISPTVSLAYGHPDIPHDPEDEEAVISDLEMDVDAQENVEQNIRPAGRRHYPIFNMWAKRDSLAQNLFPNLL
nr:uncharacterized protein LOC123748172 [Procambarus clarkii]